MDFSYLIAGQPAEAKTRSIVYLPECNALAASDGCTLLAEHFTPGVNRASLTGPLNLDAGYSAAVLRQLTQRGNAPTEPNSFREVARVQVSLQRLGKLLDALRQDCHGKVDDDADCLTLEIHAGRGKNPAGVTQAAQAVMLSVEERAAILMGRVEREPASWRPWARDMTPPAPSESAAMVDALLKWQTHIDDHGAHIDRMALRGALVNAAGVIERQAERIAELEATCPDTAKPTS